MKQTIQETEHDTGEDAAITAELQQLATSIEEWRKQRQSMTKAELLRRYPGLGDDRTFSRCLQGDTSELNAEKWLLAYRQVSALIEIEPDADEVEEIYNDFTASLQLRNAFTEIAREQGNARVIIVLGWPGLGKTASRLALQQKFGTRVMCVEAMQIWHQAKGGGTDRPLLRAIARELRITAPPLSSEELLNDVIIQLRQSRRLLVIEEAHHLCSHGLDVIKALVNNTPGEFCLLAHPRLWDKLESKAFAQCRQLTTNRLGRKITLKLAKNDVSLFIERRVPGLKGAEYKQGEKGQTRTLVAGSDLEKAAALIHKNAQQHGNFAFVRGCCKRTRALMHERALKEPTLALITEAVKAELSGRDIE